MSRTDKDRPRWVTNNTITSANGTARHNCNLTWAFARNRECDIDEPFDATAQKYCRYVEKNEVRKRYRYTRGPNTDERHLDWWGPARANERQELTATAKRHRAGEPVDDYDEDLVGDHRHSPWQGGYWD